MFAPGVSCYVHQDTSKSDAREALRRRLELDGDTHNGTLLDHVEKEAIVVVVDA